MPRKKGKNKYKRRQRKRYERYNASLVVPSGMPKTGRAKLSYCENLAMVSSTGNLTATVWRAGGAFDPRYASGGHQPMGFDQWAVLFNHYTTAGSRAEVTFNPIADSPAMCGIYLEAANSPSYTIFTEFVESGKGQYALLNDNETSKKLVCNYSAKKFFNLTNLKDNNSRIGADVASSPTEDAFFIIWMQSQDLGTTMTVNGLLKIDYIFYFFIC